MTKSDDKTKTLSDDQISTKRRGAKLSGHDDNDADTAPAGNEHDTAPKAKEQTHEHD
ncbi:MAG: hypothetical protein ACI81Q_000318 [Paracoccaceae bacterium]|jgi:hypothetical protein